MHSSHAVVVLQRISLQFTVVITLWSMLSFPCSVEQQGHQVQFAGQTMTWNTHWSHAAAVQRSESMVLVIRTTPWSMQLSCHVAANQKDHYEFAALTTP